MKTLNHAVIDIEDEFDRYYHPGGVRTQLETGVCRGLALALAIITESDVEAVVSESLQRLEDLGK